jgi:hypothetical protein
MMPSAVMVKAHLVGQQQAKEQQASSYGAKILGK